MLAMTSSSVRPTLSTAVSDEVRATLARRRVKGKSLAEPLGLSQSAISRRLTGETAWELDELKTLAEIVDLDLGEIFAAALRTTQRLVASAEQPRPSGPVHPKPADNRPPNRQATYPAAVNGVSRTPRRPKLVRPLSRPS